MSRHDLRLSRTELGRFRVHEELGRGSFSVVFDAEDTLSGERVALKLLRPEIEASALKREFRIARDVRHPHVVRLHELHAEPGRAYFTMERVIGPDLVTRCQEQPSLRSRVELARRLFSQLAVALEFLHGASLVHRDVKPGNVLVERATDRVVLVDLGLARLVHDASRAGAFSGTLAYAAPERLRTGSFSPQSDWFGFGVLLFEALVGTLPMGPDPARSVNAWLAGRTPDVRGQLGGELASLADLVEALLQPEPARRATASDVLHVLANQPAIRVRAPVVGRTTAMRWLDARIESGTRRIAVVGPSGIGKTTLLREAQDRHRSRHLVLTTRCHPTEYVAFNALDGAIVSALDAIDGREEDDEVALVRRAFEGSALTSIDVGLDRLARALAWTLRRAARGRPVLLFIDDVQWSDADSVQLLEHLSAEPDLDLRCILAARGDSSAIPVRLRPASDDLHELEPLDEITSIQFIKERAPDISPALLDTLVGMAGGRPLLLDRAAAWAREADVSGPTPNGGAELVRASLSVVDDAQRELLLTLAIHEDLDTDVLAACPGGNLTVAYELLERGLVEFERTPTRYRVRLRHPELQTSLDGESPDRLRERHARVAEAFLAVRPEDADAIFVHFEACGDVPRARDAALRSALASRRALAFRRAAQRFQWLVDHEPDADRTHELEEALAEVLARAGDAARAGEVYLRLASDAGSEERRARYTRTAAEQFLRAGDGARGRALLDDCLRAAGMPIPSSPAFQIAIIARHRMRAATLRFDRVRASERVDPTARSHAELAWTAGLGLSLVDMVGSMVAQARFTSLAVRSGDADQLARAAAVEYSYSMMTGGALAALRGTAMRRSLDELRRAASPYSRAMIDLSRAVGDIVRGSLNGAHERIEEAQRGFEGELGAKTWEITNCGMWAAWLALEQGRLGFVAESIPALLRLGDARGDRLYRQCFIGGYSGAAWLIRDEHALLEQHLDSLEIDHTQPFQISHFYEHIARVRLDLYRGRPVSAWQRVVEAWPRARRAGLLAPRFMRWALAQTSVQAAASVRDDPAAQKHLKKWLPAVERIDLPVAGPWARAVRALTSRKGRWLSDAAREERALDAFGYHLAALAIRQRRAEHGERDARPNWPEEVVDPSAFATAMGLPTR